MTRGLVAVLTLLLVLAWWRMPRRHGPKTPDHAATAHAGAVGAAGKTAAGLPRVSQPERETRQGLRRALLRQELALEQLRYGGGYWEAELSPADGAALDEARRAVLAEVSIAAEGETLEPFFGPEQAGPCVRFLAPDARERFLDVLARVAGGAPLTTEVMLIAAREALSEADFAEYVRWNAPETKALRERLAGFAPSQHEFDAIIARANGAPEMKELLRAELGEERFAEWRRQESAEMQTALRDVRRVGGAAADAVWLCAQRRRLVEQLAEIWNDAALTTAEKERRSATLKQAGREVLAARWPIRGPELPEIDLLP